jgi:hypothetical protein
MMTPRCRRGTGTPSVTIRSVAHGVCFGHPLRETLMFRYPHALSTPLRISRELDIVGDLTATVDTPSALLAWAHALPEPVLCAWRAEDSGTCYIHHVSALCRRAPLCGQVTAARGADHHRPFWSALLARGDWHRATSNSCRSVPSSPPGRPPRPHPA